VTIAAKPRKPFLSLPLFARIGAGYALILMLVLPIAFVVLLRLHYTATQFQALSRDDAATVQAIDDLRVQLLNEQVAILRFNNSSRSTPGGDDAVLQSYFQAHNALFGDIRSLVALTGGPEDADLVPLLANLTFLIQAVEEAMDRDIATIRAGLPSNHASDYPLIDLARAAGADMSARIAQHIRIESADIQAYSAETTRFFIIACIVVTALTLAVCRLGDPGHLGPALAADPVRQRTISNWASFPLGIRMRERITVRPVEGGSRVQYG
jgi:CHASE3 domain sensor protein